MLRRIVIIAMSKSHRWTPPTSPPARNSTINRRRPLLVLPAGISIGGFCHGRGARTQKVIVMECE